MDYGEHEPGRPTADAEYLRTEYETSRRIIILLFILGTLFLFDIVTTQIILITGGIEMNPLMAGIVAHPILHFIVKILFLLVIFPVSLVAERKVKGSSAFLYWTLITLYVFVDANNAFVIIPHLPH